MKKLMIKQDFLIPYSCKNLKGLNRKSIITYFVIMLFLDIKQPIIMRKIVLLFILINNFLFSQSKENTSINLDSISIHYSKDAFESYRDSLDTYLSRLDKSASRKIYFKLDDIEGKDTLKFNGIIHLSRRLKIDEIEYISPNNLDEKTKNIEKGRFEKVLYTINSAYRLAFYRYHGKHFGCEYSGGKIWKFLVADKTRKHFKSALKGVNKYSFGVELNKNRISFIKTKLKGFEDDDEVVQEMFINFKPQKERKIYLADAEIISVEPKKNRKYYLLLDFR